MEKRTKKMRDKDLLEWFEDYLPADIAALAINNTDEQRLGEQFESLDAALYGAFVWSKTEQGHKYWDDIANQEDRWLSAASEVEECSSCDGVGELRGDPSSNDFPACPACNGSGDADRS
jgi:DnaJ-class molecular chaperone